MISSSAEVEDYNKRLNAKEVVLVGLDIDESKIPIIWKSASYWLQELNDCTNVLVLVQHPQSSKVHVGKLSWKIYK